MNERINVDHGVVVKVVNPLSKCQDFHWFWTWVILEQGRVLHKGAWVTTLLGILGVQDYKKVKFSGRDISSLAAKGSLEKRIILSRVIFRLDYNK